MEAIDVDEVWPREALGSSSRVLGPLTSVHAGSPAPGLATAASLDAPVKAGLAAVILQRQGSRENGSAESDGLTNDDASSAMGDPECASRSPDVLESTSFQAVSPAHSQAESVKSKSPDADGKGTAPRAAALRWKVIELWISLRSILGSRSSEGTWGHLDRWRVN